jgi:Ni,Fe-hydrogenase maturation factor
MNDYPDSLSGTADILIMGIGNLLMSDEGVGIHFVRLLEKETLPPAFTCSMGEQRVFYSWNTLNSTRMLS